MTTHEIWTMLHGMGFGALYLIACSGAVLGLWRRFAPGALTPVEAREETLLVAWLVTMAALAWITVLTGTYIVYPWYRAVPPPHAALADYPQRLLLASPATRGWHAIGMEWKEHVAWLVPIAITAAAAVFTRYRRNLRAKPALYHALLGFVLISFFSAAAAGFFGAMLTKHAPVQGGATMRIVGEKP